jgi:hypothetical protein
MSLQEGERRAGEGEGLEGRLKQYERPKSYDIIVHHYLQPTPCYYHNPWRPRGVW